MNTEPSRRIIKDNFSVSHSVDFCPSSGGSAALFLTHYTSKVHVTLTGPINDKMYARYEGAAISVSVTRDTGEPVAGASGKLLATVNKRKIAQDDALLIHRIQSAFNSVIDHSVYKRCTFNFAVHIMHVGENFLSTVLCGCMLALLSAGVECLTTLVPQSIIIVKREGVEGDAHVLVNPSNKHINQLAAEIGSTSDTTEVHYASIAHDISGESVLSLVFDACPLSLLEAFNAPVSSATLSKDPKVRMQSLSLVESIARSEIAAFVQWMKSTISENQLRIPSECPQETGAPDEVSFVKDE